MEPRKKVGGSTYIEAFMLIAAASVGAMVIHAATLNFAHVVEGPAAAVSNVLISQGSNQVIERMIVQNTGTV